jgi:PAS domain S-box-containing protein
MEKKPIKVLLIEDNLSDALLLTKHLDRDFLSNFELIRAEMLTVALGFLRQGCFDAILLDLGLPDSVGLETFTSVQQAAPALPIIILSGQSDEALALEAVQAGAQDYLVKGPAGWGIAARSVRYAIERKQTEEKLRESGQEKAKLLAKLNEAQHLAHIGSWEWDLVTGHVWWSDETYQIFDVMPDTYFPDFETNGIFVHPDDFEKYRQAFERSKQTFDPLDLDIRLITGAGVLKHCQAQGRLFHDDFGKPVRFIGTLMDITERKLAEQSLRESNEKYRRLSEELDERVRQRTADVQDLYDNAPTGYHSLDEKGCFLQINQTELKWWGYSRDEMIGRPLTDFITNESINVFKQNFPGFKQRGWLRDLEMEFLRKDRTVFQTLVNATAIKDKNGNYLMSRSTVVDITERKQTQGALSESEETYRALFENANDAIFLINPDGSYFRVNPRAVQLLGVASADELIGRASTDFTDATQKADIENRRQAILAGKHLAPYERTFIRADGTRVETEITLSKLRDQQGNIKLIQSLVRDITARKHAEQALRESRDQLIILNQALERASRSKDEFLANMSHELRTPLNGILGMSEILLEGIRGPLNERQQKMVEVIDSSGRHLLNLINDVLDLSKIEAEKFDLSLENVSVSDVCQASLNFIKEPSTKKGVIVNFVPDPGVINFRADARRLKQILVNLLSNAVKFTPFQGKVTLMVKSDLEQNIVHFSVSDTGIGIAPDDMQRLFQPFTQVDSSLTRRNEGTGLGLALVKRLVELHGGAISVTSEIGRGSCFTVSLPWRSDAPLEDLSTSTVPAMPANQPASNTVPGKLGTILLAEDNETNIMTLGDYLEIKGYQMVYARDGRDALEKVAEIFPDLILMDIQMPEIDGLEVIRRLRGDPRFVNVPIVALTALAMEGDKERCLEAGATDYVSKPVSLMQLTELIRELLDKRIVKSCS